jgi:hypothetical protein
MKLSVAKPRRRWRLSLAVAGIATAVGGTALLAQQPDFVGMKILSNGNFGVNTGQPERPLHVVGDALITGTLRGRHPSGAYGDAAVIQGFSGTASDAPFVLLYAAPGTRGGVPSIRIQHATSGVFKSFIIGHPTDPERYLVHATLEGPEGAVYYRGSARLEKGRAEIVLPPYFEALTRREGRTVLLTAVDGFDPLAVVSRGGARIEGGRFIVESSNRRSRQAFDWEVKAVRADGERLAAEPLRSDIAVAGDGPYTYVAGRR